MKVRKCGCWSASSRWAGGWGAGKGKEGEGKCEGKGLQAPDPISNTPLYEGAQVQHGIAFAASQTLLTCTLCATPARSPAPTPAAPLAILTDSKCSNCRMTLRSRPLQDLI